MLVHCAWQSVISIVNSACGRLAKRALWRNSAWSGIVNSSRHNTAHKCLKQRVFKKFQKISNFLNNLKNFQNSKGFFENAACYTYEFCHTDNFFVILRLWRSIHTEYRPLNIEY